ncbi:methyltransferase [Streptomyces lunaelactis]|uniref:Protein-L-isoaspartate O-methyltransferase n=1 Tax=Streptomyces lunaelactis TaxID=1535768 RepID=A0A2R4T361_9ACTN|nr:ATP-grasp peptide maturase system methyltransferase [Streptomyces lunaelactis]AVZ73558.1 methyltransferase [Streptomyces lunaelactis]NUK84218.1 methyltransferase domain-containing protein [Streptomyces lunaelactis]
MTTETAAALRRHLVEQLVEEDLLHDPELRRAAETVPRETFLGSAIYKPSDPPGVTVWTPTRRDDVPADEWLRLTYQNTTWVTQIDGVLAEDATDSVTGGTPTSSSTLPGVILWMIERAGTVRGKRALIIGAGTGLSTAYVCEVLGEDNTTAIETDPAAAERARKALAEAGYAPTLITGDGLRGHPEGAPYDIVIAFCSMRHIPYGLLRQVKEGGTVVVTLAGWGFGHGLVRLTVDDEGGASGRFLPGYTSFMMARTHDLPPHGPFELLPGEQRPSRIDPATLDDWSGRFVAQLAAPSAERLGLGAEQILLDVATGSQARTRPAENGDGWTVVQRGPLKLWDAVEDAVETWQNAGSPHLSEFGLTITPDAQRVWLGTPDGPSWVLPV